MDKSPLFGADSSRDRARAGGDRHSRGGRPTLGREGEVDRRLLEAATELFLQRGFERTSCDQVALRARAGKASLYARYPNKEALFVDVVRHMVHRTLLPALQIDPALPLPGRLMAVGSSILHRSMQPDAVALTRMIIAEAPHMSALVREVDGIRREAEIAYVVEAIIPAVPADASAATNARAVAERFVELVFVPHQMRALLGDSLTSLKKAVPARVKVAIETIQALKLLDRLE